MEKRATNFDYPLDDIDIKDLFDLDFFFLIAIKFISIGLTSTVNFSQGSN